MNKESIVRAVAAAEGVSQASARRIIEHVLGIITSAIRDDGRCEIGGFGVFKKYLSAAVSRPNPQDRTKIIHTPARYTVKFQPSPSLKGAVRIETVPNPFN